MKVAVGCLLLFMVCFFCSLDALAAQQFTLRGKVLDAAGQTVQGAEVFIYDTANTRRPADFITARTDRDGRYSIQLPEGRYWAVARVRQGEKFGPLAAGAKHSGEPLIIEDSVDGTAEQDFVVADIREVAKGQRNPSEDFIRVTGRVLDKDGKPVNSAYVVAAKAQSVGSLPDYVSAWTDESGGYTLYLPVGSYYLGAAREYPPGPALKLASRLTVQPSKIDIAIDVTITLE